MKMECLWYNGEVGSYELLEFNPKGLTKEQIISKATELLKKKYGFDETEMQKALETLYLIETDDLKKVIDLRGD